MKKQYLVQFILAALLFAGGVACKKSSGSGGPGNNGTMKAEIDGTLYTCTLAVEGTVTNGFLSLGGRWNDGGFTLGVANFKNEAGTYKVGTDPMTTLIVTLGLKSTDTYSANMVIGSGSLVVTSYSANNIKGTFSFDGYNTDKVKKSVTKGEFDINLK